MTTDITPAHLRCGSGFCPTVNYKPAHLRCSYGGSCSEITGKDGLLIIVGKQVEHPKAGPGEAAVEIGEEYFSDFVKMKIQEGKSPGGDRAVVNEAPDGSSPFGLPSLLQAEFDGRWTTNWAEELVEGMANAIELKANGGPTFPASSYEALSFEDCREYAKVALMCPEFRKYVAWLSSERDQSPKGGDGEAGSVHAGPVPEGNSPSNLSQGKETT